MKFFLRALFLVALLGHWAAAEETADDEVLNSDGMGGVNGTESTSTTSSTSASSSSSSASTSESTTVPSSSETTTATTTALPIETSEASSTTSTSSVETVQVEKKVTKVSGSMSLTVSDPEKAAADPAFKQAVSSGIAATVGVPAEYVEVEFSVSRRLRAARRLEGLSVAYTITIPEDAPASVAAPEDVSSALTADSAAASLTTAITSSIEETLPEGSFTVEVASVAAPTVAEETIVVEVPVTTSTTTTTTTKKTSDASRGTIFITAATLFASLLF